jgi:hypothetical protein
LPETTKKFTLLLIGTILALGAGEYLLRLKQVAAAADQAALARRARAAIPPTPAEAR